jgi:hypothetical protein
MAGSSCANRDRKAWAPGDEYVPHPTTKPATSGGTHGCGGRSFARLLQHDRLGWDFVGLIDGERIKEYADDGEQLTRVYRHQLAACAYEVLPGPGRRLRWGVPESIGHYDLLISAALTGRLDQFDRRPRMARENGSGQVRS